MKKVKPIDLLTTYYQEVTKYQWGTVVHSPYYYTYRHSRLCSAEICRTNWWYYLMEHHNAQIAIVGDHCHPLDSYLSGIPFTNPREMHQMSPVYRDWQEGAKGSYLSRFTHKGLELADVPCILLYWCPFLPYFEDDKFNLTSVRDLDFKEHQLLSQYTIKLLKTWKIPLITIGKRSRKLAKVSKLNFKYLDTPAKRDEGWPNILAKMLTK